MDTTGAASDADGADGGASGTAADGGATGTAAGQRPDAEAVAPEDRAERLLVALRTDEPYDDHLSALSAYEESALARLREDRETALAFWLNLYNAGTQLLLERRPALYESRLRTVRFFQAPCLTVAGTGLSLDDVEHGILRGSRSKYGLGYLPRLRPSGFERRFRLDSLDPRVHFALNCGAASCPPIRAYEPDAVDDQLDLATAGYLDATVEYDSATGVARIPRLFLWYRGDFGGAAGVRAFLREHGAIPADADPKLRHRSWDWSRSPGKFHDGE